MYNLIVTENAKKELDEILDYISNKLLNPTATTAFVDEVFKCYSHLETNPKMYEECSNARLKKLHYRRVVIKNFILVYRIDEAKSIVYVVRFFYGKRDYERLI